MSHLTERGDTLVEVVMALGILSLVLVSSYALSTGTFRLGRGAGERNQAVGYLQQQAEVLRDYRDRSTDWITFQTKVSQFPGTDITDPSLFFCMKKDASLNTWAPVLSSDSACKIDGTTIRISAKPTDEAGQTPPRQYTFSLRAEWKTGSTANNVSLQTTLVDQIP